MKFKIFSLLVLVGLLAGCANVSSPSVEKTGMIATIPPLAEFTSAVSGEDVYSIVPAGVDIHDFELSPSDFRKADAAKYFVTIGLEFEGLEDQLVSSSGADTINSVKGLALLESTHDHGDHDDHDGHEDKEDDDHDRDHEHDEHHEHGHAGGDVHLWVSPRNAILMVSNIANELSERDSANSETFLSNADAYTNELHELDDQYRIALSNCEKDTVLVSHNAFAYLGRDYGFDVQYVSGVESEAEPSPQELVEIVEAGKSKEISVVLSQMVENDRVAQAIARELDAEVKLLLALPITNSDMTYVSMMQQNLESLKAALQCQSNI